MEWSADDDAHNEVDQREEMRNRIRTVTHVNHTFICVLLNNASTSTRKREEIGRRVCAAREGANHHGDLVG